MLHARRLADPDLGRPDGVFLFLLFFAKDLLSGPALGLPLFPVVLGDVLLGRLVVALQGGRLRLQVEPGGIQRKPPFAVQRQLVDVQVTTAVNCRRNSPLDVEIFFLF